MCCFRRSSRSGSACLACGYRAADLLQDRHVIPAVEAPNPIPSACRASHSRFPPTRFTSCSPAGVSVCVLLISVRKGGASRAAADSGSTAARHFCAHRIVAAIVRRDRADQHLPRRQRARARDLGKRQSCILHRPGGHRFEGPLERRGGDAQGMFRAQRRALRQRAQIGHVAAHAGRDFRLSFGRQRWVVQRLHQRARITAPRVDRSQPCAQAFAGRREAFAHQCHELPPLPGPVSVR